MLKDSSEIWILLGFPSNLLISLLTVWLYQIYQVRWLLSIAVVGIIATSIFFLPVFPSVLFWLPGGASTVLVGTIFSLIYMDVKGKNIKFNRLPAMDRKKFKDKLLDIKDISERQAEYSSIIKKTSSALLNRDKKIGYLTTRYFLYSLLTLLGLNFSYWFIAYSKKLPTIEFIEKEIFSKLLSNQEAQDILVSVYTNYTPILILFFNTITLFILILIIRMIKQKKKDESFSLAKIDFFKLPHSSIFFYLPLLIVFLLMVTFKIEDALWGPLVKNMILIFSFFYLLQGAGISILYLNIRLLPINFIFGIIFLLSYFIWPFFLMTIGLFFCLGLLDFAFNIREKALQPGVIMQE